MNAEAHQSTRDLLVRAKAGDAQAREALVSGNLALVKYIVKRFLGRGAEYDDLYQYGCLGLLKAIDRFDPGYQVQFSTYAVPVILGEIRRYLRDDGPIHVSRTIREMARRVDDYVHKANVDGDGCSCSVEQIASALNMEKGDVLLALNSKRVVRSLDESIGGERGTRLMDVIGTEPMIDVDHRLTLAKILKDLPAEDRDLIVRRYFKQHTQTQIARDMGTSQVQVSRMEHRILNRMRDMANASGQA